MSTHETLGLLLVREGLITRPQLYDALRLQRQNNRLLGTCLISLGYVQAEKLLAMLSHQLSVPALPPGEVRNASSQAIAKVPHELAQRLRVVPYSWDGRVLGIALADGRTLNHLHEIAFYTNTTVGAYVALEADIEDALRRLYPTAASATALNTGLVGRPRPARVASNGAGQIESENVPVLLTERKTVILAPPALSQESERNVAVLQRIAFFEAVEKIYEASSVDAIGSMVGRALLNYFCNTIVFAVTGQLLRIGALGGLRPARMSAPLVALPQTRARIAQRGPVYGKTLDPRADELRMAFGFAPTPAALLLNLHRQGQPVLLVYADNGTSTDIYEDLHDIEMLCKEADTSLGLLG